MIIYVFEQLKDVVNLIIMEINCNPEVIQFKFDPPHAKTNKISFAPSEDSDQPGHSPSLTRVFVVHMKNGWILSNPLTAQ